MKKNNSPSDKFDERIDELLARRVVRPSSRFTEGTIARIRATPDLSDERLDAFLSARPVAARNDFTRRTVALAVRRNQILYFFRPALAAAASIAVCLMGIWTFEGPAAVQMAAQPENDNAEIVALANALSEAAPLLEDGSAETLTCLIDGK